MRPDHAQLLQLPGAVGVHVAVGVAAPVVGDPLPERESASEAGHPSDTASGSSAAGPR
ncbi:hypothetical protein [Streptomyces sp. NPDC127020]|uniref:hypothetical protein n=1 Tax=Streptomyces sp. NPDC127020 TaxID=3347109 RepID=UPI00364DA95E